MTTYRLFQSPNGEIVRVKQGFSWQAFLVGSLTTMVRRLWWLALLAMVPVGVFLAVDGTPDLGTRGIVLAGSAGAVCVLYMLFCGLFGNRWLVESLRRRGFLMIGEETGAQSPFGRHPPRGRAGLGSGPAPGGSKLSRTARAGTSPSP